MNNKNLKKRFYFIAWQLTLIFAFVVSIAAQTNSFTYQGKLNVGGAAATGSYEMRFTLYNQADSGFQIGTPKTIPNVAVTNGIFTVQIPFGDWTFDDNDRFMKIEIRPQGNTNAFTALAPLQQITLAPKALYSNLSGIADFSNSSAYAVNSLKLNGLDANRYVQKTVSGEIVAPRLENLAADPAPASASNVGRIYFNTTTGGVMFSDGTAWRSLSPPKKTVFTANTTFAVIPCTSSIRSVTFAKSLASSRLRIVYNDSPYAASFGSFSGFDVEVKIDGAVASPVRLTRSFSVTPVGGGSYNGGEDATIIGYADGIGAGNHTLTTSYSSFLIGSPACYRPSKYLIEIEEIP